MTSAHDLTMTCCAGTASQTISAIRDQKELSFPIFVWCVVRQNLNEFLFGDRVQHGLLGA